MTVTIHYKGPGYKISDEIICDKWDLVHDSRTLLLWKDAAVFAVYNFDVIKSLDINNK